MATVQAGDLVQIHYTGRFPEGDVFDSSEGKDPLSFTAGSADLIPGVSQAVIGMSEGEKKTVTVAPAEGYGEHNPNLLQKVERSLLPEDVSVGDQLQATTDQGQIAVWVRELTEAEGLVDANHPLAGKTLVFDLELVSVTAGMGDEEE